MIFPEGTCTNRTCLITFKPGTSFPSLFPFLLVEVGETLTHTSAPQLSPQSARTPEALHPLPGLGLRPWELLSGPVAPLGRALHAGSACGLEARHRPVPVSAGAFIPGVPVQPVVLRYPNRLVSVCPGATRCWGALCA